MVQTSASPVTAMEPPTSRGRQSPPKILRACVVQSGKVIEEQRLRRRESLSVGYGPRNTFVIADNSLPKTHQLFVVKGSQYELVLTEGMRGRLSVANQPVDFATLKSQGVLKKKGDFYSLELSDQHRGKVVIGEVTIIFQFVVPPPAPKRPQLPAAARGNIWQRIDWPYTAALLAAFVVEAPIIAYFQVAPRPTKLSLEDVDDRWADLIVPDLKKEEKKEPKDEAKGEGGERKQEKKDEDDKPKDEAGKAKVAAARKAKIQQTIAGKGMLAILGTTGIGAASGAVADVFGDGGVGGDLDAAFDGITGVGLATGSTRTTRGSGSGDKAVSAANGRRGLAQWRRQPRRLTAHSIRKPLPRWCGRVNAWCRTAMSAS